MLSCSDSRVAPELIFDCHPGEVFVVRNAGNSVEPFGVASLEHAITALGVRLIMVVGHSGCGAIKAAIETVEKGTDAPGHLPSLINDIRPSIEAVRGKGKAAPSPEAVIRAHVARGVADCGQASRSPQRRPEPASYNWPVGPMTSRVGT